MSVYAIIYILSGWVSAVQIGFMFWWDMNTLLNQYGHERSLEDRQVTLKEIIYSVIVVLCPVINTLAVVCLCIYFVVEVAPKIVVFGPKQ